MDINTIVGGYKSYIEGGKQKVCPPKDWYYTQGICVQIYHCSKGELNYFCKKLHQYYLLHTINIYIHIVTQQTMAMYIPQQQKYFILLVIPMHYVPMHTTYINIYHFISKRQIKFFFTQFIHIKGWKLKVKFFVTLYYTHSTHP